MTTQEKKPGVAKPRIVLACTGKTLLRGEKVGLVFAEVQSDGLLGKEYIYARKNLKQVRVGSVYDVESDPADESINPSTMRWLQLWKDEAQAATWQTLADAFDTHELVLLQERKEAGRKLAVERLAPLRREYWRTNALGRLAIEVRVLAYLRQERT